MCGAGRQYNSILVLGVVCPLDGRLKVTCARLSVVADAVDDVVRHFRVLRHRQDVVTGDSGGVPDQEHAVSLAMEERHRLLAVQPPPVPAIAVSGIKMTSHGRDEKNPFRGSRPFPFASSLLATHTKLWWTNCCLWRKKPPKN